MLYLGCHLSASGGNCAMVKTALSIGANTFAFFTRNPRGSKAKQEDPADAAKAVAMLEENQFGPLVAHGAYTMNLCTAAQEARQFAAEILADDLRRTAALPGSSSPARPRTAARASRRAARAGRRGAAGQHGLGRDGRAAAPGDPAAG